MINLTKEVYFLLLFLSLITVKQPLHAQVENCEELLAEVEQFEASGIWRTDLETAILKLDSFDKYALDLNCNFIYASNKIRKITTYGAHSKTRDAYLVIKNTQQYIDKKLLTEEEEESISVYLNYTSGRYHNTVGNLVSSKKHYEDVINFIDIQLLKKDSSNIHLKPITFRQLGLVLMGLGRYNEAIPYFEIALKYPNSLISRGITLKHLGESARILGFFDKAQIYYERAHDAYQEAFRKTPAAKKKRRHNIVTLLSASALCYMDKASATNNPQLLIQSEAYFQKAFTHLLPNDSYAHITYRHYADLKKQQNQLSEAEYYYKEAIQTTDSRWEKAKNFIKLGQLQHLKRDYTTSLQSAHEALSLLSNKKQIAAKIWETPEFKHIILDPYLLEALKLRIDNLYALSKGGQTQKNYLELAKATADIGAKTIDSILFFYQSYQDKESFISNSYSFFESALKVCYAIYELDGEQKALDDAFRYAEQSKAIVLHDLYIKNNTGNSIDIPDHLREKEEEYQTLLYSFNQKFQNQNSNFKYLEKVEHTNQADEYFQIKKAYSLFQDTLRKFRRYENARNEMAHWTIKDIQASLSSNQSLLSYFIGKTQSYAFVLNHDAAVVMVALNFPRKELTQTVKSFFECSSVLQEESYCFNEWVSTSYKLYESVFYPIQRYLKKKTAIIPDGPLCSLPFSTLLSHPAPKGEKIPFSALDYLLHKFAFSYNYSAFTRLNIISKQEDHSCDFMGIAPTFVNSVKQNSQGNALRPLINGPSLIQQLSQYFPNTSSCLFSHEQATKEQFKRNATSAKNIHIHTHGIFDEQLSSNSFIAFHPSEENIEDAQLYLNELYELRLTASMISLPACHSGYGKSLEGQGLVSIARGLIHAGVESVFPSLWGGNDDALSEITNYFYEFISKENDRDEAMRLAKIRYLANYKGKIDAFPYFWGGYIPIGNMDINAPYSNMPWTKIIGAILLLTLLPFFFFRKKRNYSTTQN